MNPKTHTHNKAITLILVGVVLGGVLNCSIEELLKLRKSTINELKNLPKSTEELIKIIPSDHYKQRAPLLNSGANGLTNGVGFAKPLL